MEQNFIHSEGDDVEIKINHKCYLDKIMVIPEIVNCCNFKENKEHGNRIEN